MSESQDLYDATGEYHICVYIISAYEMMFPEDEREMELVAALPYPELWMAQSCNFDHLIEGHPFWQVEVYGEGKLHYWNNVLQADEEDWKEVEV